MKEQPKRFDERVFESVISGGVDFYKVASPLVKITETSEKTREKASEKSSGRLVDGLVENDTINDTTSSLYDNERTVFEGIQINPNVAVNELSEMLDINLRNTKKIIGTLEEKGVEKVTKKVTEKVTENQQKILKSMANNPHITALELTSVIGISERKIKENIRKLKQKGLLRRIGAARGGYWEVVDR